MTIKLGDKVRFLNENMEGIVTSFKGNNQIGVTIESDFEIPVLSSEVVKINFEDKAGNNPDPVPAKSLKVQNSNPLGVFLAFERNSDTDLDMHVHNNLADEIIVLYYHKLQGVYHLQKQFRLNREESIFIGKTQLNQFDKWPNFHFVILPIEPTSVKPALSISSEFSFQAKTFHNYFKHCFFLAKQAYVFSMDAPIEKLNLTALKQKDFSEKVSATPLDLKAKPSNIIDLHYDALQANGFGSASDITTFQMDVFTQTLEAAFVHRVAEMVYIHGVGNAYLKNKIRTYLSKHPETVHSFEDADILKFGSGATLVVLK
jgi:hypothetical protein